MGTSYSAVLFVGAAYSARDLFTKGRGCKCGKITFASSTGRYCPECGGRIETKYTPGPLVEDDPDGGYRMACGLDLFCETDIENALDYDRTNTVFIGSRLGEHGDLPEDVLAEANWVREIFHKIEEFADLPVQVHALLSIG